MRAPPRRPGGRSVAIAIVLSLVIPGLGHVYTGRLGRALIWFAGALVIGVILDSQAATSKTSLVVLTILGVAAALDAWMIMKVFPPDAARGA